VDNANTIAYTDYTMMTLDAGAATFQP